MGGKARARERVRQGGPRRVRRQGRLTREGKAFVFVTVGVGVAAVNTGNNLLYLVLGLLLSLLLLSMVLSEVSLRRLRVERRLPERAFAGSPCVVELVLLNRKDRLPSHSIEVEDRSPEDPTDRRCYFLKVAAGAAQVAGYHRTPAHRGPLRLSGYRITTRYPFGLVEKSRLVDASGELLVYPALAEASIGRAPDGNRGLERTAGREGHGNEIAGLRDYVPGDEARSIHWRRTASLGRLVVRERQRDASAHLTLEVDNARPPGAGEDWDAAFESSISEAASQGADALREGSSVEVVTRGSRSQVLPPGSPPDPLWAFLARLEAVPVADDADSEPAFASEGRPAAGAAPHEAAHAEEPHAAEEPR